MKNVNESADHGGTANYKTASLKTSALSNNAYCQSATAYQTPVQTLPTNTPQIKTSRSNNSKEIEISPCIDQNHLTTGDEDTVQRQEEENSYYLNFNSGNASSGPMMMGGPSGKYQHRPQKSLNQNNPLTFKHNQHHKMPSHTHTYSNKLIRGRYQQNHDSELDQTEHEHSLIEEDAKDPMPNHNTSQSAHYFKLMANQTDAPIGQHFKFDEEYSQEEEEEEGNEEGGESERQRSRQEKMKALLKDFKKKKQKMINESIKSRMVVEPHQKAAAAATRNLYQSLCGSNHVRKSSLNTYQSVIVTEFDDDHYKTNYTIKDYKKGCGTCKIMNVTVSPRKQQSLILPTSNNNLSSELHIPDETPHINIDKLKQKVEHGLKVAGSKNKTNSQQAKFYDYQGHTPDDLVQMIEDLQNEKIELKKQLKEDSVQISRIQQKDELILKYQEQLNVSKMRLNKCTGTLKDTQSLHKNALTLLSDLSKAAKLPEKQLKLKMQETSKQLKQLLGNQETIQKLEQIIKDNNLQAMVADQMNQMIRALNGKEINKIEREQQHQQLFSQSIIFGPATNGMRKDERPQTTMNMSSVQFFPSINKESITPKNINKEIVREDYSRDAQIQSMVLPVSQQLNNFQDHPHYQSQALLLDQIKALKQQVSQLLQENQNVVVIQANQPDQTLPEESQSLPQRNMRQNRQSQQQRGYQSSGQGQQMTLQNNESRGGGLLIIETEFDEEIEIMLDDQGVQGDTTNNINQNNNNKNNNNNVQQLSGSIESEKAQGAGIISSAGVRRAPQRQANYGTQRQEVQPDQNKQQHAQQVRLLEDQIALLEESVTTYVKEGLNKDDQILSIKQEYEKVKDNLNQQIQSLENIMKDLTQNQDKIMREAQQNIQTIQDRKEKEIIQLNDKIQRLEPENSRLQIELQDIKSKVNELEVSLKEAQSDTKISEDKKDLQIAQLKDKIKLLEPENERLQNELQDIKTKSAELEVKYSESLKNNANITAEKDGLISFKNKILQLENDYQLVKNSKIEIEKQKQEALVQLQQQQSQLKEVQAELVLNQKQVQDQLNKNQENEKMHKQKIDDILKSNEELRAQHNKELGELIQKIEKIQHDRTTEFISKDKQLADLEKNNHSLKSEKDKQIEEISKSEAILKTQVIELQSQLQKLNDKNPIEASKIQIANLTQALEDKEKTTAQLQLQNDQIKQDIDAKIKAHETSVQALKLQHQDQLQNLQKQIDQVSDENKALKLQVNGNQVAQENLQSKVSEELLHKEIEKLKSDIQDLKTKNTDQESTYKKEIEQIESQAKGLAASSSSQIKGYEQSLEELKEQNSSLLKQIEDLQLEFNSKIEEKNNILEQTKTQQDELQKLKNLELSVLEQKIKTLTIQSQELTKTVELTNQDTNAKMSEIEELKETVSVRDNQLVDKEQTIQWYQEDNDQLHSTIKQLESRIKTNEEFIKKHSTESEQLKVNLIDRERQNLEKDEMIKNLQDDKAKLAGDIKELKSNGIVNNMTNAISMKQIAALKEELEHRDVVMKGKDDNIMLLINENELLGKNNEALEKTARECLETQQKLEEQNVKLQEQLKQQEVVLNLVKEEKQALQDHVQAEKETNKGLLAVRSMIEGQLSGIIKSKEEIETKSKIQEDQVKALEHQVQQLQDQIQMMQQALDNEKEQLEQSIISFENTQGELANEKEQTAQLKNHIEIIQKELDDQKLQKIKLEDQIQAQIDNISQLNIEKQAIKDYAESQMSQFVDQNNVKLKELQDQNMELNNLLKSHQQQQLHQPKASQSQDDSVVMDQDFKIQTKSVAVSTEDFKQANLNFEDNGSSFKSQTPFFRSSMSHPVEENFPQTSVFNTQQHREAFDYTNEPQPRIVLDGALKVPRLNLQTVANVSDNDKLMEENENLKQQIQQANQTNTNHIKAQKEQLKQLSEFAVAISGLDDRLIENNFNLTIQKRNKAPLYKNVDQKIKELDQQLRVLTGEQPTNNEQRLSETEDIEYFSGASNEPIISGGFKSLPKIQRLRPMNSHNRYKSNLPCPIVTVNNNNESQQLMEILDQQTPLERQEQPKSEVGSLSRRRRRSRGQNGVAYLQIRVPSQLKSSLNHSMFTTIQKQISGGTTDNINNEGAAGGSQSVPKKDLKRMVGQTEREADTGVIGGISKFGGQQQQRNTKISLNKSIISDMQQLQLMKDVIADPQFLDELIGASSQGDNKSVGEGMSSFGGLGTRKRGNLTQRGPRLSNSGPGRLAMGSATNKNVSNTNLYMGGSGNCIDNDDNSSNACISPNQNNNTTTNNNNIGKKVSYLKLPKELNDMLSQRSGRNKSAFKNHSRSNIHVVNCDSSMGGMTSIHRYDTDSRATKVGDFGLTNNNYRGTIKSTFQNSTLNNGSRRGGGGHGRVRSAIDETYLYDDGYEVRVKNHDVGYKDDVLQFMQLQALLLEDQHFKSTLFDL